MNKQFLKFSNAYKNDHEDYTNMRIRIDNITDYEISDRKHFKDANYYSETMRRDLGNIAYGIVVRHKRGNDYNEHRVYFWTKKQRDATMTQIDEFLGLLETAPQAIQDLPTL